MKTAMSDLIEWLKVEKQRDPIDQKYNIGLTVAINFATKWLEKENEQLIEAWSRGFDEGYKKAKLTEKLNKDS